MIKQCRTLLLEPWEEETLYRKVKYWVTATFSSGFQVARNPRGMIMQLNFGHPYFFTFQSAVINQFN